jgi:hypothetical protein
LTVPRIAGHIFNPGQISLKIPGQISVEINNLRITGSGKPHSLFQAVGFAVCTVCGGVGQMSNRLSPALESASQTDYSA